MSTRKNKLTAFHKSEPVCANTIMNSTRVEQFIYFESDSNYVQHYDTDNKPHIFQIIRGNIQNKHHRRQ